jgi:hypothetical protein
VSRPEKETGSDELRRLCRAAEMTRMSALDGFTPEEIIKMIRACWASGWDIFPDDLLREDREFAAKHGRLAVSTLRWLEDKFGESLGAS